MSAILLKNGIALLHNADNHVIPTRTSVLIEGKKITKIAQDIEAGAGTEVIDCVDKIISPGFIDTHHHGWQTQLKGRHANELFMEYMISGMVSLTGCKTHISLILCRQCPICSVHSSGHVLRSTGWYAGSRQCRYYNLGRPLACHHVP